MHMFNSYNIITGLCTCKTDCCEVLNGLHIWNTENITVLMLHKLAEPDKTGDNILLVYFCYACLISRLIVFFFHQTRHAFRYKFISTIGIGMLGNMCGRNHYD